MQIFKAMAVTSQPQLLLVKPSQKKQKQQA
jgi:hypothetical protein